MALPVDPPARHRAIAAAFCEVAHAVQDWAAPTPVPGWTAEDVVDHLITWSTGFLAEAWQPEPAISGSGWATRFEVHSDGIQGLLDQRDGKERYLSNPHVGQLPVPEAIDRFYTSDIFLHTWDLGRSAGIDVVLDEQECATLLAGMMEVEELLRASGQFGQPFPVPDDASVADRLIGFIGRDPAWKP